MYLTNYTTQPISNCQNQNQSNHLITSETLNWNLLYSKNDWMPSCKCGTPKQKTITYIVLWETISIWPKVYLRGEKIYIMGRVWALGEGGVTSSAFTILCHNKPIHFTRAIYQLIVNKHQNSQQEFICILKIH